MRRAWLGRAATGAVCLGLFALLSAMVLSTPWQLSSAPSIGDDATVLIGQHFFSDYLLPFELASVLLLMALVGAIILARREFIPDEPPVDAVSDALTLPERPRELVAANRDATGE